MTDAARGSRDRVQLKLGEPARRRRRGVRRCAAVVGLLAGAALLLAGCGAGGHGTAARRDRASTTDSGATVPARRAGLSAVLDAGLRSARARFHAPAATAAVVACGRVVWADATGVLDLRSRRTASNGSLFVLNSAAKTVVATMIMQEIHAGRLSLDTKLSRFYPQLPNASGITVRMLLNMTSGIPEYLNRPRIKWTIAHQPRRRWTRDQVLTALGTGLGKPDFAPGRRYQYSDTNYIVLGGILEKITRSSIEHDFDHLIARPLGLTSATFVATPAATAQMGHPYFLHSNGSLTSTWIPGFGVPTADWGPVWTDGGLASSALDLARFANALLGDRLLSAKSVDQMIHPGLGHYGFGVMFRSFDGHSWVGHNGVFGGYEAEDWSDLSRQLTIAVETNVQKLGRAPVLISDHIWRAIARAYDGQQPAPESCRSEQAS